MIKLWDSQRLQAGIYTYHDSLRSDRVVQVDTFTHDGRRYTAGSVRIGRRQLEWTWRHGT